MADPEPRGGGELEDEGMQRDWTHSHASLLSRQTMKREVNKIQIKEIKKARVQKQQKVQMVE